LFGTVNGNDRVKEEPWRDPRSRWPDQERSVSGFSRSSRRQGFPAGRPGGARTASV